MYARSSTFRARPDSIDAGVAFMRDEVMPAVLAMPGCSGMSMMADRRSGRCIATTAWDAMEPMRASAGQIAPMRERGAVILGAVAYEAGPTGFGLARGEPFIEEWEIAVLHRAHRSHQGACVRATWMWMNPATVGRAIDTYRMVTSPAMEDLQGLCSASLFVDRVLGRAVSSVTYDTHEAMNQSREAAEEIRVDFARDARTEVLDVAEFDLVIAHLRVSETT